MSTVPQGHSDSLRDQIVRAICPGRYTGPYPNVWIERADKVLSLVTPDTIRDPLDPTYQRGFVAGVNAVLTDVSVLAPESHQKVLDEARASGYVA